MLHDAALFLLFCTYSLFSVSFTVFFIVLLCLKPAIGDMVSEGCLILGAVSSSGIDDHLWISKPMKPSAEFVVNFA